jgi:hypothetical protein
LAIDTVKIRANASYKQFRTAEGITKERKRIRERVKELIEKADDDETAKEEVRILENRENRLKEAKKELKRRIQESQKDKAKAAKAKINVTDFDCSLVQQGNGEINSGYAVTTSVDGANQIITGFDVKEDVNDAKALLPAIDESEEKCGARHETVLADAGFSSMENLEELKIRKQDALIPDRRREVEERGETAKKQYDRSQFKYNKEKNIYTCPQGEKLPCMGQVEQNGRTYKKYGNPQACAECKAKTACTKSKSRIICRDINEELKEDMRKRMSLKRNDRRYRQRAPIVESPYGNIKQNMNFRMVKRRGRLKIKMEAALLFMLHNILKIGRSRYESVMVAA